MAEFGLMMKDAMTLALLRKPGDPLRKFVTRRTSDQWLSRKAGDKVWIKECFAPTYDENPRVRISYRSDGTSYGLNNGWADGPDGGLLFPEPLGVRIPFPARWRPSVLMPRWASRMSRIVASIRIERGTPYVSARDAISDGDPAHPGSPLPWVDDAEARREGVEDRAEYLRLWESINGPEYPGQLFRIEFENEEEVRDGRDEAVE